MAYLLKTLRHFIYISIHFIFHPLVDQVPTQKRSPVYLCTKCDFAQNKERIINTGERKKEKGERKRGRGEGERERKMYKLRQQASWQCTNLLEIC
jgi:hypothetical protein